MQPRHVRGEHLAKRRDAEVLGIEGVARLQRVYAGAADEFRRHLVRFAEPEGQHVLAAHADIGDFTDLGTAKGADRVASGEGECHEGACSVVAGIFAREGD